MDPKPATQIPAVDHLRRGDGGASRAGARGGGGGSVVFYLA